MWQDPAADSDADVLVRVSTDGGSTFTDGPTTSAASAIAVGDGVIYVLFVAEDGTVSLTRSVDEGRSWGAPAIVAADGTDDYGVSITAEGDEAYAAFRVSRGSNHWIQVVRTTDRGATWSSPLDVTLAAGWSYGHVISLQAGTARLAYSYCLLADCEATEGVAYRESIDGAPWSSPELVAGTGRVSAEVTSYSVNAVGFVGRALVVYTEDQGDAETLYVRVRSP